MPVFLATLSALVYGTADFMGGLASKRTHGVVVTAVSQMWGLLALAVALLLWPDTTVTSTDIWAGLAAGVGGGLGLICFYPALAAGPMSVVAPTTAVCSAVVPLVVGLATGERPSALALTGALLALPAVVLVARESGSHGKAEPRIVALSVAAGVGFGLFFVGLAGASSDAGMWPLAAARMASLAFVIPLCLLTRRGLRVAEGALPLIAFTGMLDVTANGLYLLAAGQGLLSVVAVLGSLYPASTVLLAMAMLHERLSRTQVVGLVLAGVAVALIAIGN